MKREPHDQPPVSSATKFPITASSTVRGFELSRRRRHGVAASMLVLSPLLASACGASSTGEGDPIVGTAGLDPQNGAAGSASAVPGSGPELPVAGAPSVLPGSAGASGMGSGQGGAMTGSAGAPDPGPSGVAGADGAPAMGEAGAAGAAVMPDGPAVLELSPAEALITGVRYYTGATPANRTSGPVLGPTREFEVRNAGTQPASVALEVVGADAAFVQIEPPRDAPLLLEAGQVSSVGLRLLTDDASLTPAPAQDDGATVLQATLRATSAASSLEVRLHALVLTFVELEPTFGQILGAFRYGTDVGAALANDANPNVLTGVQPGTDEIAAPSFQRVDSTQPVQLRPIARFSPPGVVPFGFYTPGNALQTTVVAMLDEQTDPHTNNGSRLLEPPVVADSVGQFAPDGPFSLWVGPPGINPIYGEDADNADGQHRIKVFVLRDAAGNVVGDSYLVGAEEANNGDYQDYVFVLSNVAPN